MRKAKGVEIFGTLLSLVACNSVTGAGDIEFIGVGGAGGTTSVDGANQSTTTGTTSSTSAATQAANSVAASSTIASSSIAASSSSGTVCMYPSGPYGVSDGKVIPPSLQWKGYLAGGEQEGTLTSKELFDCDGSKGINAIFFETSQYG